MKSERTYPIHNYNGVWMLVGLVALLVLPLAVGYANHMNSPVLSLQADASVSH